MLVISRKPNESVQIDSTIQVTILSINRGRVKLGIKAPGDVPIVRNELIDGRAEISGTKKTGQTRRSQQ